MSLHKLKTGDRIRAREDRYPARAGATARVCYVRETLLYVVVEWDSPEANLGPERTTELSIIDLQFFDLL